MIIFDEASFQNKLYTQRLLYKRETKHTPTVNPYKFKINARNGNSTYRIKM